MVNQLRLLAEFDLFLKLNRYDITYPLPKEICERQNIYYHGTGSCFCNKIEIEGWTVNAQPYNMEDIQEVTRICDSIGYESPDVSILRAFTTGRNGQFVNNKPASFSERYWEALGYAKEDGGETISHLLRILRSLNQRNDLANSTKQKIRELYTHYGQMVDSSYPVVYVIQAEVGWIEHSGHLDFVATRTIPASAIIARIDYPQGSEPLEGPFPWDMDWFLQYLRDCREDPEMQGLIKFYNIKSEG